MKSYMFMLERRIIKYSLLLLKLAVMLYITVTRYHFTSLGSAISERQAGSIQLRAIEEGGWATGREVILKPHLTILMLTNYLKELLCHQ